MKDINKYHKGSEWRKWDLHVHTPFSEGDVHYGNPSWDKFVNDFNTIYQDYGLIGINDYNTIHGYQEVAKSNNQIECIPSIEFRISEFAGSNNRPINLHIYFDPKNIEKIECFVDSVFNGKFAEYSISNSNYSNTFERLKALGAKMKETSSGTSGPLKTLKEQYALDYKDIIELLKKSALIHKKDYLLAFGLNELQSWQNDTGTKVSKNTLYERCINIDFILVATPENKMTSFEKFFTFDCNGTTYEKPILHASDAHKPSSDNSEGTRYIGHCFTWIKADPTFDGLKIALLNPKERIYVGIDKPEAVLLAEKRKNERKIIEKISIYNTDYGLQSATCNDAGIQNLWFHFYDKQQQNLYPTELIFNHNLIAIIGNQGSGKSALLDIIARGCGLVDGNNSAFSFLTETRFLDKKNSFSKKFKVKLTTYGEGENGREFSLHHSRNNGDLDTHNADTIKIDYITQHYLRHLETEDMEVFMDNVNNILFDRAKYENKLQTTCKTYQEYQGFIKKAIENSNYQLRSEVASCVLDYIKFIDLKNDFLIKYNTEYERLKSIFVQKSSRLIEAKNELDNYLKKCGNDVKSIKEEGEYVSGIIGVIDIEIASKKNLKTTIQGYENKVKEFHTNINLHTQNFISSVQREMETLNEYFGTIKAEKHQISDDTLSEKIRNIIKNISPTSFIARLEEIKTGKQITIDESENVVIDEFSKKEDIENFLLTHFVKENEQYQMSSKTITFLNAFKIQLEKYVIKIKERNIPIAKLQEEIKQLDKESTAYFGSQYQTTTSESNILSYEAVGDVGIQNNNDFSTTESDYLLNSNCILYWLYWSRYYGLSISQTPFKLNAVETSNFEKDRSVKMNKIATSLHSVIRNTFQSYKEMCVPLEYDESTEYQTECFIKINYLPLIKKNDKGYIFDVHGRLSDELTDIIVEFHEGIENVLSKNTLHNITDVYIDNIVNAMLSILGEDKLLFKITMDKVKNSQNYNVDYRENIVDDIFSFDFFTLAPKLYYYENTNSQKDIHQMSLGEKTEAILHLFLKAGETYNHPILIDQPENNLDNQAMSTRVCSLLKNASKHRQVFVVTHSPNIAILSDADQIIKVSIDKSDGLNQFHVVSGSIENNITCNSYIQILEGGFGESFEKRARGYSAIM